VGSLSTPEVPDQPRLPIQRWPDAILQGKSGGYPTQIHAVYNLGSNLINQGSHILKSIAAFQKLDFAVTHDLFLTPTARYCDVVLPAASPLEKEDVGQPWLGNYLLYKPQVVAPRGQARSDYDILCDLADRLGFAEQFSEGRSAQEWIQLFIEQSEVPDPEEFRRTGIYLAPDQERVGLADFSAHPLRFPLKTPSGKVEIASEAYHLDTGFPAIPTWQEPPHDKRYPLQLLTPKVQHRTHSQGSNLPLLREKHPHRLTLHPRDAAARRIEDGDRVKIFNDQGEAHVVVELSQDILPGVVSLPEGIWLDLDANGVDRAGSANMLTSTEGTTPGTACIMHAVNVEIEKI
jgi:anaerobic dimethyl sulfoxide reductase subunit A